MKINDILEKLHVYDRITKLWPFRELHLFDQKDVRKIRQFCRMLQAAQRTILTRQDEKELLRLLCLSSCYRNDVAMQFVINPLLGELNTHIAEYYIIPPYNAVWQAQDECSRKYSIDCWEMYYANRTDMHHATQCMAAVYEGDILAILAQAAILTQTNFESILTTQSTRLRDDSEVRAICDIIRILAENHALTQTSFNTLIHSYFCRNVSEMLAFLNEKKFLTQDMLTVLFLKSEHLQQMMDEYNHLSSLKENFRLKTSFDKATHIIALLFYLRVGQSHQMDAQPIQQAIEISRDRALCLMRLLSDETRMIALQDALCRLPIRLLTKDFFLSFMQAINEMNPVIAHARALQCISDAMLPARNAASLLNAVVPIPRKQVGAMFGSDVELLPLQTARHEEGSPIVVAESKL